jgi:ATP-dependent helicase YprA (DUF1998 family)
MACQSSAAEVRCAVTLPKLYPHQLDHGKDLNEGRNLFLVIAPGLGKSIVLFTPLIAAQARGERGIAFMIAMPTKVLAEQQVHVVQGANSQAPSKIYPMQYVGVCHRH